MKIRFLIIFVVILISVFFLWQGIYLPKDFNLVESKLFLIESKQSVFQIAENLEKQGLIRDKYFFIFYVIIKGETGNLQAGEYILTSNSSMAKVVRKIATGDILEEKITIIEGWNLRNIGWYFENRGMFQAGELFELVGFPLIDYSDVTTLPQPRDFSQEYNFLKDKPKDVNLEGYLFPDTYEINKGTSIETIVKKMLNNFDKKLTSDLREEITRQNKSIFEIITMASLLEKEVQSLKDKEMVSGILWKRLKFRVPLQVDATIIYITGKKTTKVSRDELQIDSPYNTYRYLGLPFGPICNPGIESILATLYPKDSSFWYYLSTPDGETKFSRTLLEHNITKAKYLNNKK